MTSRASNSSHSNRLSSRRHNLPSELRKQAAVITEDARELAVSARDALVGQLDPVREAIVRKPLQAMLIAGGIGIFMGFLFRHR